MLKIKKNPFTKGKGKHWK